MIGEDIPKTLKSNKLMRSYGDDDSDDEDIDAMAESFEIQMGIYT